MCGILGIVQAAPRLSPTQFGDMLDTLSHRGPDGRGVQSLRDGRVLLGHRRLAIIDLSPSGAQPMCNEDGSVWLTFNGEIYNYKALRSDLLKCGHIFRSESDSEVIVHAYEQWGRDCVTRLRGIFAFGLWDDRSQTLLLARDHIGVKPLYYGEYAGTFAFASQPKALIGDPIFQKRIDPTAWRDFFAFGYVPHQRSAFAGISKLPAGHTATLRAGRFQLDRYWQLRYQPLVSDPREAATAVRDLLAKSVRSQLVSDVPVGCFLSGGIDSSLLVALAREHRDELRTFTVGFNEALSDERTYARAVADRFSTRHFEGVIERGDVEHRLLELQNYYDEPFDPNGPMPFLSVSQLARSKNTVVVLGGDGADEIFSGYLRYDDFDGPARLSGRSGRIWRKLRSLGLAPSRLSVSEDVPRYFGYEGCLRTTAQRLIFRDEFLDLAEGDELDVMQPFLLTDVPAIVAAQYMDMHLYLVDHILCKIDRASMAFGVETRVPFLDPELVELAFQIPPTISYRRSERKSLLKKVAADFLPQSVLSSRKKGFSSPLGDWTDSRFSTWARGLLEDGYLVQNGVLRDGWQAGMCAIERQYGMRPHWLLLTGELWARRWLA